MEISEVRVKLIQNPSDRLKAFCSVTFDGDFVIRDIKIIEGTSGIFVAMPSRKLADHCPKCHSKNHLRAQYCNECGAALGRERGRRDDTGRRKLHADIAHPINSACRSRLQERVVEAYEQELEASKRPDYQPTAFDDEDFDEAEPYETEPIAEEADETEQDSEQNSEQDSEQDDYGRMIAELKRDAAERRAGSDRGHHETRESAPVRRESAAVGRGPSRGREKPMEPRTRNDDFGAGITDPKPQRRAAVAPKEARKSPPPTPSSPAPARPSPAPSRSAPASPALETAPVAEPPSEDDDFGAGLL